MAKWTKGTGLPAEINERIAALGGSAHKSFPVSLQKTHDHGLLTSRFTILSESPEKTHDRGLSTPPITILSFFDELHHAPSCQKLDSYTILVKAVFTSFQSTVGNGKHSSNVFSEISPFSIGTGMALAVRAFSWRGLDVSCLCFSAHPTSRLVI